jgi:hypothetical protein
MVDVTWVQQGKLYKMKQEHTNNCHSYITYLVVLKW